MDTSLNINSLGALKLYSVPFVVESGSQGTVSISMDVDVSCLKAFALYSKIWRQVEVAALGGEPLIVELELKPFTQTDLSSTS